MSSRAYATPLRIERRPSRRFACFLAGAHLAALAVLPPLDAPLWPLLALAVVLIASLIHTLREHALLRAPRAVVNLVWEAGDEWRLVTADGREEKARLLRDSYAHPWLIVLRFAVDGRRRRRAVVLFPDGADPATLRQLRVRLALSAGKTTAASVAGEE